MARSGRISWFPDSQLLVFHERPQPGGAVALTLLSLTTGEKKTLIKPLNDGVSLGDGSPSVAPDGRSLAFIRAFNSQQFEIFTVALAADHTASGEPRQLTRHAQLSDYPAWTADGRDIVYSSGTISRRTLWRVAASGSSQPSPLVLVASDQAEWPAIARQGNRLAYIRNTNDDNIWRLRVAEGKAAPLIHSTRREFEPRLSPDGSKIVYTSDRSGPTQIWLANADGSGATQLTSLGGSLNSGPHWSPDGQRIVFLSNVEGQLEVYLVGIDGGPPVRLTHHPAHDSSASFSRDGKWIYFASDRSGRFEVWKMPPNPKASPVQVTRNGGFAPIESLDGKYLYYTKRAASGGLWKAPLEGGEETRIADRMLDWANFEVTQSGVYYIADRTPSAPIYFYNSADASTKIIAQLQGRAAFGLTASLDGKTVLYTQLDHEASELALVENFR
jgi:Tol biopolymer transport system component